MEFKPRQIEIIQAATKLIGEKGVQNVTTKHLADEIGFSEAALYRYFKSKTEILQSVLEYYKQKMRSSVEGIIAKPGTGREKINRIIKFQFELFTKEPAIIMVIFAESSFQYNNTLSNTVSILLNQKQELINRLLKQGTKDGSIRTDVKPEQLTSIILGSMRFTVLKWRLSGFDFDLNDKGAELCDTIDLLLKNKN
jgi:AcrR family transcriptional regulator